MGKQTFDIGFLCRESKANRLGMAPIELTIVVNQERTYLRLQMKAKPKDFKLAMQGKGFGNIQDYCRNARSKIDELVLDMSKENIPLTAKLLKEYFMKGGVYNVYTLKDMFSEFLTLMEKRVGKDLSKDTYNRYVKTARMFMEYNKLNEDTPAKIISFEHIRNYQVCLNEKYDPATSCNYLQKIKSIFKYTFETGKIPSNPSYGLKIDKGVKDTVLWLNGEELNSIKTHEFASDRLQKVADCFLFSCYTGLSIGDMEQLCPEDFQVNKYGFTYIDKKRRKTGVRFCAILLEDAKDIAKKYNYNIPVISTQKTNEYLKEIAEVCKIEKPLHYHMARHTCAAYLINYRPAIPNETIQRIMGWEDGRMLRHYASIFNTTVFSDINKAFAEPLRDKPINVSPKPNKGQEEAEMDEMEWFKKELGI